MKPTKLCRMIPPAIVNEKLKHGCSELQPDFMGFEENYFAVAEYLPQDFTVIDLGCYQAPQCYIFKNHIRYIGVDVFDASFNELNGYIPPERFIVHNTEHYRMTIEAFMDRYVNKEGSKYTDVLHLDMNKTYFIMSAVPNETVTNAVFQKIVHGAVFYPGTAGKTKGIFADEILHLQKSLTAF